MNFIQWLRSFFSSWENPHFIELDIEDFRCLTRGGILTIHNLKSGATIKIHAKDISFKSMEDAVKNAKRAIDIFKGHEKRVGILV